jgi:hypothetical protein
VEENQMTVDRPVARASGSWWRSIRAVSVLMATIAGLVGFAAAPAHAESLPLYDSFEGDYASRWDPEWGLNSGGRPIVYDRGVQLDGNGSRTGRNNGALTGGAFPDRIPSLGRYVNLTVPAGDAYYSCKAQIYMYNASVDGGQRPFIVNFEVIDPATWTYVALGTFDIRTTSYRLFSIGVPNPGGGTPWSLRDHPNVFIRISAVNPYDMQSKQVNLDDLAVDCRNSTWW